MRWSRSVGGLLGLFALWAALFVLIYAFRLRFGDSTVQSLDMAITGGLSFALVILYFRQTQILDSQRELLTQELNHEARRQHTETLKERIRLWHGDIDRESPEEPFNSTERNIPQISGTDIESAPAHRIAFAPDDTFQVVPYQLQNDRYLEDFLENHAPDVLDTSQQILELQEKYTDLMESFTLEEIEPPTYEEEEYRLEPTPWFDEWIFRQVVQVHKGVYEDLDEIADRIPGNFENATGSGNSDDWKTQIPVRRRGRPVYQSISKTDSWDGSSDNRDEIDQRVINAVQQVLRGLPEDPAYSTALEGAQVFENAADAISKLEQLLIEYEGRPIIQGDCEYLEESKIG